MKVGEPDVSMESYHWRSANIGPDRIDIQATDPHFRELQMDGGPSYYFIGVLPYSTGLNTMLVSLTLLDA